MTSQVITNAKKLKYISSTCVRAFVHEIVIPDFERAGQECGLGPPMNKSPNIAAVVAKEPIASVTQSP